MLEKDTADKAGSMSFLGSMAYSIIVLLSFLSRMTLICRFCITVLNFECTTPREPDMVVIITTEYKEMFYII